jgi:peptide chain release factor 1
MISLEKLNGLEERFQYLEVKLAQPLNGDEIKSFGVEYSELKLVVEKIRQYKKIFSDLTELKDIMNDPDLRSLALEEDRILQIKISNKK